MVKNDCFAYDKQECAILYKQECDNCKFYKTDIKRLVDDINTIRRLISIGYPKEKLVDMPGWSEYINL